tara:strand:- start:280 stop:492 length:213 start_codon:yes stop_codon:yes gene_type:complete
MDFQKDLEKQAKQNINLALKQVERLGFKIVQRPIIEKRNHVECYMEQNPCNDECYEYSEMLSAKYEGMNQ